MRLYYFEELIKPKNNIFKIAFSLFMNKIFFQCETFIKLPNPCSKLEIIEEAQKACFLLIDPNDSFKDCNQMVFFFVTIYEIIFLNITYEQINISKFQENCELDYCASIKNEKYMRKTKTVELSLCDSFAAAAAECLAHSINIEWRKNNRCRIYFLPYF